MDKMAIHVNTKPAKTKISVRYYVAGFILFLIVGVVIWVIYRNQIFADVTTDSTADTSLNSGVISVKLTKELADYVRTGQGTPSRAANNRLDQQINDLTKAAIQTVNRPSSSGRTSVVKSDTPTDNVVVYLDEKGQPILPDLAALKANSRSAGAVCPRDTNKLTLVPDDTWSAAEKAEINSFVSQYYPIMVRLFGPPIFNISVKITHQALDGTGFSGQYISSSNQILLSKFDQLLLIHETAHAFHDDLSSTNPYFEEGWADLAARLVYKELSSDNQTRSANALEIDRWMARHYELSKNVLMSDSDKTWYDVGSSALYKIYLEDNNFIKRAHCDMLTNLTSMPNIQNDLQVDSIDTIEGKGVSQWLNKVGFFNPPTSVSSHDAFYYLPRLGVWRYVFLIDGKIVPYPSTPSLKLNVIDISGNKIINNVDLHSNSFEQVYVYEDVFYNPSKEILRKMGSGEHWYQLAVTNPNTGFNEYWPVILQMNKISDYYMYEVISNDRILFTTPIKKGKVTVTNIDNNKSASGDVNDAMVKLEVDKNDRDKLPQGRYRIDYSCSAYDNNTAFSIRWNGEPRGGVLLDTPVIQPNSFNLTSAPKVNQRMVTINFSLRSSSNIVAKITGSNGRTIRSFNQKYPTGNGVMTWDGRDTSNRPVPRGSYRFTATATDQYCQTNPISTTFSLR